ncbi:MAG: hypothetical protein EA360_09050 [Balneolaceae bacterium]|nr:MAG: hypothetical protein EA360_09050 [Balneolaceae bacterium]
MTMKKQLRYFILFFLLSFTAHSAALAQIKLDVGGYMQNWYIANQSVDAVDAVISDMNYTTRSLDTQGFRIRRARMTARGRIGENFSATTWIELAGTTPSLLDFHIDAHIKPWFNIRMGQFMMPGQSYDTSRLVSSRLIFYERAPITTRFSNVMGYSAFRDVGAMIYGQHGRLWYGVHAGNGAGRFNHAGSVITERKAGGGLYGARFDLEAIDGFTIGAHVATNQQRDVVQAGSGPFDINRKSYSLRAATNDLGIEGLFSQIEYMYLTANDDRSGFIAIDSGKYKLHGFYAELGYKLTREWHIQGRLDEMVEKPTQLHPNLIATRTQMNNYTLGLSRYIFMDNQEIVRIHLNYSFGETGPADLNNSILVMVFQLRFIP